MTKEGVVVESILRGIREERWVPGSCLPKEKEQEKEFGVSRVTVRRAMGRLERHSLIERRQGSGTYLLRMPTEAEVNAIVKEVMSLRASVGHRVFSKRTYRLAYCHDSTPEDHVYRDLYAGIMAQAKERGHEVLTRSINPESTESRIWEFSDAVYQTDAEGLILHCFNRVQDHNVNFSRIPCPYVLIDPMPLNNAIYMDITTGCRQAVGELSRIGHRHIAVLEKHWRPGVEPFWGHVCRELASQNAAPRITFLYGSDPLDQLMPMLSDVTGMLINDDVYAVEVCQRLAELGRTIGKDMDVITQSERDFEPGLPPEVGRIEFDFVQLGAMAVQMLERLLDNKDRVLPPVRVAGKLISPQPV